MEKDKILQHFQLKFPAVSVIPYGQGHINQTFLAETSGKEKYILQGINKNVFPQPEDLMENIVKVTLYLKDKIEKNGGNPERETLSLVPALDGNSFFKDEEGNYWRVYLFIEDAVTLNAAEQLSDFYESGIAFGRFQSMLRDFPAETLHWVIPDFHNTAKRFQVFEKAVEQDICGRAGEVKKEIDFIRQRREEMSLLDDMLKNGELPLRVTHNDTKLNNVMLDGESHKALCVIDLDTVMPGLSVHDFGDAIRFGANTAAEDEQDLDKVSLSLKHYEAYKKGFLEGCEGSLTENELRMLPMGAKMMTLECGMRFLTDYLSGDTYFKVTREKHNVDRCRCQLALVADMERKWKEI
ncbi:MAG: aminoglycoside phosphotransferase family protein [Lachnospiraceae bacterium]|nr:aminoglycoside phosphotransferase family protein [Lachnospiraceae bacterium]MDE6982228.1 aminoglycoside phosphotransferase family protein [Lachnospiraceae bacterium]